MKRVSFLLLLSLGLLGAQAQEEKPRRLEGFHYDAQTHHLGWTISQGHLDERGEYVMEVFLPDLDISLDEAVMKVGDEERRFSRGEAAGVQRLLEFLARYCTESTIWWDEGKGEPVALRASGVKRLKLTRPLGPNFKEPNLKKGAKP